LNLIVEIILNPRKIIGVIIMINKYTLHGEKRVNQRGLNHKDLELVCNFGVNLNDRSAEVYLLRHKDAEDEIRKLKRKINALERMRGCKVVLTSGNALITAHYTTRETQKNLLRRAH
jgi:hypothetical protein